MKNLGLHPVPHLPAYGTTTPRPAAPSPDASPLSEEALDHLVERAGATRIRAFIDAARAAPQEALDSLELRAVHRQAMGQAVLRSPRRPYAQWIARMDALLAGDPSLTPPKAARIVSGSRAEYGHMSLLRRWYAQQRMKTARAEV